MTRHVNYTPYLLFLLIPAGCGAAAGAVVAWLLRRH
jgi:hypothetical protein